MNITLIGMPGAGKSTVGVVAAKMLNMNFIDTDLLIQQKYKKKLWQLIEQNGTDNFIKLEESTILENSFNDCIIATGGSAVYGENAMNYLKSISKIIYLKVPCEEIKKRVGSLSKRGVICKKGNSIEDILEERSPLFEKYADIIIDCSKNSLSGTAEKICEQLNSDI